MLRTNTKRIAWFLSLQQILRFPRFFMAPSTIFRPGRGSSASDLETAGKSNLSTQGNQAASARSNTFPALSLPVSKRTTSPIDGVGLSNALHFVRSAASTATSDLPPWRAIPNLNTIAKPGRSFETYPEQRAAVGREFSAPEERSPSIGGLGDPMFTSKDLTPLAPIGASSPERGLRTFDVSLDPPPTTTDTGETPPRNPSLLRGEQPIFSQSSTVQYQSPLSDQDGKAENNQPKRGKPTVSTLHIDGSALGRWTVQHLERALGKPATGMTGVDPRATIPRSRVAPF
jgi:hypothetical protein